MKLLKQPKQNISQDEMAQKIADGITSRQQLIADFLNNRIKSVSRKKLIISFVVFCTMFASYLTYLLISAMN